jgi:hypothetical protein
MKKFLVLSAIAAMSLMADDISQYEVTINKIEICTGFNIASGVGSGCQIVKQGAKAFNIASATAGADVGNYLSSSVDIPDGSYNYVKVTIAQQFKITGCDSISDKCTAGNTVDTSSTYGDIKAINISASASPTSTIVSRGIPLNAKTNSLASLGNRAYWGNIDSSSAEIFCPVNPIVIASNNVPPTISVSFGVANSLTFLTNYNVLVVTAPDIKITIK